MTAFLWTQFVLLSIGVLFSISHIAKGVYPRQRKPVTADVDLVGLLVGIAFTAWTAYLLFAR